LPHVKGIWRPDRDPSDLVARGPLVIIEQHYLRLFRSSARCQSPEPCRLCELQSPRQTIALVPCSALTGEVIFLLRLTSSHAQTIQAFQTMSELLQGLILQVSGRPGPGLIVTPKGRTVTTRANLANYFAAIGQKTYRRSINLELRLLNSDLEAEA